MHHFAAHDLIGWLVRGFAMSVGWMIARGLGMPAAAVVLALVALVWWMRRRRTRSNLRAGAANRG